MIVDLFAKRPKALWALRVNMHTLEKDKKAQAKATAQAKSKAQAQAKAEAIATKAKGAPKAKAVRKAKAAPKAKAAARAAPKFVAVASLVKEDLATMINEGDIITLSDGTTNDRRCNKTGVHINEARSAPYAQCGG